MVNAPGSTILPHVYKCEEFNLWCKKKKCYYDHIVSEIQQRSHLKAQFRPGSTLIMFRSLPQTSVVYTVTVTDSLFSLQ